MDGSALVVYPIFNERPSEEYIQGWHRHMDETGSPETYENVSTNKPDALENVVLLSGELQVPPAKRLGNRLVPCPICSPTTPKFSKGRMAWFPDEQTVRFIGHDCAARHFGENYRIADRRYKIEQRCRFYQHMWRNFEPRIDGLEQFIDALMPVAKAVQFTREHLDGNADGFAAFLRGELSRHDGRIFIKEDTGARDRGQIIFSDVLLGVVDGLTFISRNFRPHSTLLSILDVCADIRMPLPTWQPIDGDNDTAKEIIGRGRRAEWMLKTLRSLRDDIQDATQFLRDKNLALLEQWGRNDQSPFISLVFRWEGIGVHLRAETYVGAYYCNMVVLDDFYGKPIPSALSPALDPLTSTPV
ncbi:hypothetical protein [Rhizobium sp. BR 362]|uniref:hypothetical protein n=1 Tax=Rhizobium sp. BR 362 TaxID=3040670 RepID=UPI002F4143A0